MSGRVKREGGAWAGGQRGGGGIGRGGWILWLSHLLLMMKGFEGGALGQGAISTPLGCGKVEGVEFDGSGGAEGGG